MTTITVTMAERGRTIANNGKLMAIRSMKAPAMWDEGLFSLCDDSLGGGARPGRVGRIRNPDRDRGWFTLR